MNRKETDRMHAQIGALTKHLNEHDEELDS